MADVFTGVAQVVATMGTRGAWLRRRWRLVAINGFDVDLPDTPDNAAEFGYAGSGDNRSAFPKARVVALAECGTHAFLAAEVDAWGVGEKILADRADLQKEEDGRPRVSIVYAMRSGRCFYVFRPRGGRTSEMRRTTRAQRAAATGVAPCRG